MCQIYGRLIACVIILVNVSLDNCVSRLIANIHYPRIMITQVFFVKVVIECSTKNHIEQHPSTVVVMLKYRSTSKYNKFPMIPFNLFVFLLINPTSKLISWKPHKLAIALKALTLILLAKFYSCSHMLSMISC